MLNLNLSSIISLAEVMQYLCLFALLSIKRYPSILNGIYESQTIFNFQFLEIFNYFVNCEEISSDEQIEGNINHHPSIQNSTLLCNVSGILISYLILIVTILFFKLISVLKYTFIRKKYYWAQLNELLDAVLIDILLIGLVQSIFVFLILGAE